MHRAFAAWLTERPWHAAVAVAICGTLSQLLLPLTVLACAIPVLSALRFGSRMGITTAAIGFACACWPVYSLAPTVLPGTFAGIALTFFGPLALALLLKRTGSLNLCFQVAVLAAAVLLVVVHIALEDPVAMWRTVLTQVLDVVQAPGTEAEREAFVTAVAPSMWGALGAMALAFVFGTLLLGRWWDSLLRTETGAFGGEYRLLRLGIVLGVAVSVVFVLAFATDIALISALTWIGFVALTFQGLAAAHRSRAGGRLSRGWLTAIYVLLIVPLSMMQTMFVLATWGFADNWLRPRHATRL
jgi:hypothetical protein